jgi:probable aminopeptidase NPEPL1
MVSYDIANTKKPVNRVVIIGTIETLQTQVSSSSNFIFKSVAEASGNGGKSPVVFSDENTNFISTKHAVDHLKPANDAGASSQFLLARQNAASEGFLPVTLCALPKQVSRANSLARPHAIHAFVKANKSFFSKNSTSKEDEESSSSSSNDEVVLIVLALPTHQDTWFAAGAAVARAGVIYHNTQKKVSGVLSPTGEEEPTIVPDNLAVVYETPLSTEQQQLVQHTANAIQLVARLVDAPPNELHTDSFVQEALRVAKRTGTKATVIRGEELKEKGFGGIYGVGKASVHPPALVILSHVPEGVDVNITKSVALVGKGIVYDTGGLSIKTGGFMAGMKRDMGGAAGLLGAFEAAVQARNTTHKTPLHVVLCLAENSVGPDATRPDDIHTFYSGKTVEINNTDAEGRLVLADGVAYAVKHLNPKVLVDMATLTGAQGIATGNKIAAIYSNNEELEQLAVKAGKKSGDLVHPMPYAPEFYRSEFKSSVADMKNSVKNRTNGQVSCAGQFIGNHLGDYETNGKWIHVDMAYPVKTDDDERATGFGVAFIQSLLKEIQLAGW